MQSRSDGGDRWKAVPSYRPSLAYLVKASTVLGACERRVARVTAARHKAATFARRTRMLGMGGEEGFLVGEELDDHVTFDALCSVDRERLPRHRRRRRFKRSLQRRGTSSHRFVIVGGEH